MMVIKPGAGILVKLSRAGEYEKANLCITEDCKLFGFLDQSLSPLRESHLTAGGIVDPFNHNLPPSHSSFHFPL